MGYLISSKIRSLRDSKGYSQEFVAAKLGISQNTYSKLESGMTRLTVDRLGQLAEIFEVEPEYFLQSDSIVNNNNGTYSKGIGVIYTDTYHEGGDNLEIIKKLEATIQEQQKQVSKLLDIIEGSRMEREEFLRIISKFKIDE